VIWLLRRQVRERTAALATTNARMSAEIDERRRAQTANWTARWPPSVNWAS